jgi:glycosyltransferase involved in cell wall biosynthesis
MLPLKRPRELGMPPKEPLERCEPDLSVVVVVYNIPRQAARTLFSLSSAYQRHIDPDDYEIIIVDNGSNPPFDPSILEGLSGNFRLIRIEDALPSPAQAVNRGIAEARGEIIGVMIDGARIVTPGLLHFALHGARLYGRPIVGALGWYLGGDYQRWAVGAGYNSAREDALLASIDWPSDGYRLFEIGTLDESSVDGWLLPISEYNALFMPRLMWTELGGMEERFDAAGGGLVNLDLFRRAVESPDAELVILLGEGTFHQVHGGVSTNSPTEQMQELLAAWTQQYQAIRGCPYDYPKVRHPPTYLGNFSRSALMRFVRSALYPFPRHVEPPLGRDFDQQLWALRSPAVPAEPVVAALVNLAQQEFRAGRYTATAAVARLIRERAPDEPEPQRLLSLVAAWIHFDGPPQPWTADYHLALGEAHRLLGEKEMATTHFQAALASDPHSAKAHTELSWLRTPSETA